MNLSLTVHDVCMHMPLLSHVKLLATPRTIAHQVPLSMECVAIPFSTIILIQGLNTGLLQWQEGSLPLSNLGSQWCVDRTLLVLYCICQGWGIIS